MTPLSHADLATLCSRAYEDLTGAVLDLEFYIRSVDGVTYIAIRGTEAALVSKLGFLDMIHNVRFLPWHTKATGWGHGGFIRGACRVASALEAIVPSGHALVLTGHSLGAAIAVLCSQILHAKGWFIGEVVLFGSPKIYTFGRPKFPYPVTSYRHGKDAVTYIPRIYWHAVPPTQLPSSRRFPNLVDHRIAQYVAALNDL